MYLECFVALSLMTAVWLDVYSLYVRLSDVSQYQSEGLALANWVLYLARILNLTSAFALAFIFESNQSVRFSELILIGFMLGCILLFSFVKYRGLEPLMHIIAGFILFLPAKRLSKNRFWRKLGRPRLAHVITSFGICLFLNLAIFLPFVVTRILPEYRMSAVYLGQFMNFISTLLLMLYADPAMMRGRDALVLVKGMDGFIWGRLLANFLIVGSLVVWVGYWA
jgi:hypothetical protein